MKCFNDWWNTLQPAPHLSAPEQAMYMSMAMRGWDAMYLECRDEIEKLTSLRFRYEAEKEGWKNECIMLRKRIKMAEQALGGAETEEVAG